MCQEANDWLVEPTKKNKNIIALIFRLHEPPQLLGLHVPSKELGRSKNFLQRFVFGIHYVG